MSGVTVTVDNLFHVLKSLNFLMISHSMHKKSVVLAVHCAQRPLSGDSTEPSFLLYFSILYCFGKFLQLKGLAYTV